MLPRQWPRLFAVNVETMGGQALPVNAAAVPFREDKTARCLSDVRQWSAPNRKVASLRSTRSRSACGLPPALREANMDQARTPQLSRATGVTRLLRN